MKKLTIVLITLAAISSTIAVAKPINLVVKPNFGYRHVSFEGFASADQIVFGGSAEIIFSRLTNSYMSVKPGFEVSVLGDFTAFNINSPIVGRYPASGFTPYAHLGLAIAYGKAGDASDTQVKFLLGGGVDLKVGPNLTVGPQIETFSFDAVDIEAVFGFYI